MDSDSDDEEYRRRIGLPPIVYVDRKKKDPPPDPNAPPPPPSPYYTVDMGIVVHMPWSFESLAARAMQERIGTDYLWNIPNNFPRPADHVVKDARTFESAFLRGRLDEPLSAENRVHFLPFSANRMMSITDPVSSICESIMKGGGTHINYNLFDRSVGALYVTFSNKIGNELDDYQSLSKFITEKTYRLVWITSNLERVNLGGPFQESVKAMIRYPESDGIAGLLKFCAILFQLVMLLYAKGRVVTTSDYEVMAKILGKWKRERGI